MPGLPLVGQRLFPFIRVNQAELPLGRNGSIMVKHPEWYGLLPGIENDDGYEVFAVSVFHQLHCLVRITLTTHKSKCIMVLILCSREFCARAMWHY